MLHDKAHVRAGCQGSATGSTCGTCPCRTPHSSGHTAHPPACHSCQAYRIYLRRSEQLYACERKACHETCTVCKCDNIVPDFGWGQVRPLPADFGDWSQPVESATGRQMAEFMNQDHLSVAWFLSDCFFTQKSTCTMKCNGKKLAFIREGRYLLETKPGALSCVKLALGT